MLSDRYEVSFNLTEVYIPFSRQFSVLKVKARLADKTVELQHLTNPSFTVQTYGLTRTSQLDLQLFADKFYVGGSIVTLGDLYAAHVHGHVETWIKLEVNQRPEESSSPTNSPSLARALSEEETVGSRRFARVKLALNVVKLGAQGLTSAALQQLGRVSCPFLDKVLQAQKVDTETLDLYKLALTETTQRLVGSEGLLRLQQVEVLGVPDTFLDIEVPNLDGINFERPSSGDIATMKHIIIGLSHKIKGLSCLAEENTLLKAQLDQSNKSRVELQESINETVEAMQRENMGTVGLQRELEEARSALARDLSVSRLENTGLTKIVDQLGAENLILKREVLELKTREAAQKEMQDQINSLKSLLKEKEGLIELTTQAREGEVIELQRLKQASVSERRQLVTDKQAIESKLITTSVELDSTKDQLTRVKGELELVRSKLSSESQAGGDLYSKYDQHNSDARTQLQRQLELLVEQSQQLAINSAQVQDKMRADIKNLHEALEIVEDELEASQTKEREMRRQLTEAASQIASLEELACVKEDLFAIREDLMKQNEMNRLVKNETLAELDASADYILTQSQRSKENCQLLGQVEEALKEQEQEIETLRFTVAVLKSQNATYTPVSGDFVDEVLCEYLNHREPATLVPFVREAAEVYVFGSKRVFIRVDHGRIAVKVGGGFIPMEEFLSRYEKVESDKLQAKLLQGSQQPPENKARRVVAKFAASGALSRVGSLLLGASSGDKSPLLARRPDRTMTSPAKPPSRSSERTLTNK
jgi:hypothetical protein